MRKTLKILCKQKLSSYLVSNSSSIAPKKKTLNWNNIEITYFCKTSTSTYCRSEKPLNWNNNEITDSNKFARRRPTSLLEPWFIIFCIITLDSTCLAISITSDSLPEKISLSLRGGILTFNPTSNFFRSHVCKEGILFLNNTCQSVRFYAVKPMIDCYNDNLVFS